MGNQYLFHGIFAPVVTLFDAEGEIDWKANQELADWLIGRGIHGILLMGSTGEFSALTKDERKLFAEKMTAYIDRRVSVLVGTGSTSLKDTIELSQHAQSIGADGALVVNPYYWKYSDEQLFSYYHAIAKAVSIPVMLYNIPQLTGQSLSPDLVQRLAVSHENIVGIKDTILNIGHIRELILSLKEKRPEFAVFSAFDEHLLPALQLGAAGSINGTAIFAPELSVGLFNAFRQGDHEEALRIHRGIVELMPIYEYSDPLFLAIKEAVQQRVLRYETGMRSPSGPIPGLQKKVTDLLNKTGMGEGRDNT